MVAVISIFGSVTGIKGLTEQILPYHNTKKHKHNQEIKLPGGDVEQGPLSWITRNIC
jgi:hypothetical protein